MNGETIGWREAWLRSFFDIFFTVLKVVASFVALTTITDAEFFAGGWNRLLPTLAAHEPSWLAWTETASVIWVWSEFLVIFSNKRRRSLHDFMAGTVVIAETKTVDTKTHVTESSGEPTTLP